MKANLTGTTRSDRQVVAVGRGGVDQELTGAQSGCARSAVHPEDQRVAQAVGRDGGEIRQRTAELEFAGVDGRGGRDPADPARGGGRRRADLPVAASGRARARDDVVGADGLVDAARGRPRQRGPEHGDGGDESQADEERGGRLRRAPGTAHRILATELPSDAEQGRQGPADDAGHGPGHQGRQHADGDEDPDGTESDQLDGGGGEAEGQTDDAQDGENGSDDDAAPGGFGRAQRRDPRGRRPEGCVRPVAPG